MTNKKEITTNRTEIIYELAKYAHPSWYHSLLKWSTYHLSILLDYYKGEGSVSVGFTATEYNGEDLADCDLMELSLTRV